MAKLETYPWQIADHIQPQEDADAYLEVATDKAWIKEHRPNFFAQLFPDEVEANEQ